MKNYRFYAEVPTERFTKKATVAHPRAFTRKNLEAFAEDGGLNNCVAVYLDDDGRLMYGDDSCVEAAVTYVDAPNSGVNTGAVSLDYLRENCVRISAELAGRLHPKLMQYVKE